MALSSFHPGRTLATIVAKDEFGIDRRIESVTRAGGGLRSLAADVVGNVNLKGDTDGTLIGNDGDALKVSGVFFEGTFIRSAPETEHNAFLQEQFCIQKAVLEQLLIMNQHLACLTDEENMEREPGSMPIAGGD